MVTEPRSMDGLVYFTNRTLCAEGGAGIDGKVKCWVYRQDCPKCSRAKMSKPKDEKTGQAKIRAKEYVCPECGYTAEKNEYEESLTAEAKYVCPECGKDGEASVPFKRKKVDGVDTLRISCQHCSANIDITKKMKEKKKA